MSNYFEIKDLKVSFKTSEGVKNVLNINKLNLYKGETLGIVGESGAGKSVLAASILRILPSPPAFIESGKIIFKRFFKTPNSTSYLCRSLYHRISGSNDSFCVVRDIE